MTTVAISKESYFNIKETYMFEFKSYFKLQFIEKAIYIKVICIFFYILSYIFAIVINKRNAYEHDLVTNCTFSTSYSYFKMFNSYISHSKF